MKLGLKDLWSYKAKPPAYGQRCLIKLAGWNKLIEAVYLDHRFMKPDGGTIYGCDVDGWVEFPELDTEVD